MREFYERCTIIYDDYRTAIPPYAAAALSFYLLLLLIPAFTLIAIGTSLFNIDISELISLQHINRNCYNFTIFSTLCISFQIQKPVCLS